mgnify:CR=1 FL=1
MIYIIFLGMSLSYLVLSVWMKSNVVKSIIYVAFSISLIVAKRQEKWRNHFSIIAILLVAIIFWMDWFM